jgi:predicted neuraminidase
MPGMSEAIFEAQAIYDPALGPSHAHASTICQLPSGRLMAAWYAGGEEGHKDVAVYAAYRRMDGRWGPPLVMEKSPGYSEGNPVLYPHSDGRVTLIWVTMYGDGWTTCRIKLRTSDGREGARLWGPERLYDQEFGYMTRHKLLTMSNGELLLPLYDEREWASFFAWSRDDGLTWERGDLLRSDPGNIQPTVVELQPGRLVSLFRTRDKAGRLWRSESTDYGRTWAPLEATDVPNPNSGSDMVRLASGAIALVNNHASRARTPLSLYLSDDGARTFPVRRDLETAPGEYSYPAIVEDRSGLMQITYTHRRETIMHVATNETWLRS